MKEVKLKDIFSITKESALHFGSNNPFNLAASTAFFALFSLAPILIITISVFGFFVSNSEGREEIMNQVATLLGEDSSQLLENAIQNYQIVENSTIGVIIGFIFFFISATTLFSVVKEAINYIWRVKAKADIKRSIIQLLMNRLFSFAVILSIVVVMLLSFAVDATTGFFSEFLEQHISSNLIIIAKWINYALSLVLTMIIFLLIYKILPDVKVHWNASLFGTIITTVLFIAGKHIIQYIIGNSNLGAVYGTANSLIILLMWIYYVSIIFYFGVELCRQFSLHFNHNNKSGKYTTAFKITTEEA